MFQKTVNFLFFICIVVAAVSLPWSVRVSSFFMGGSVFFWLLNLKNTLPAFQNRTNVIAFFLLAGYYLINITGLLNSENLGEAFYRFESKLLLLVCPLIIIFNNSLDKKKFNIILDSFSYSVLVSALYCFYIVVDGNLKEHVYPWGDGYLSYSYTSLGWPLEMHPTYFSAIVSLAIFRFILTFREYKFLKFIYLLVLMAFNVMLSSRGAVAGFMAGLMFMIFYIPGRTQRIVGVLSVVVLATVSVILLKDRLKVMLHRNEEVLKQNVDVADSYLFHVRSWYCSVEAIKKSNLLAGYGTGDEADVLNDCYRNNGWNSMTDLKAHNEYLSELLRHGLPGLLLLLSMLFYPLYISIKNKNILGGAFIIIFIVIFLAESLTLLPGVLLFGLFNSLNVRNALGFAMTE